MCLRPRLALFRHAWAAFDRVCRAEGRKGWEGWEGPSQNFDASITTKMSMRVHRLDQGNRFAKKLGLSGLMQLPEKAFVGGNE